MAEFKEGNLLVADDKGIFFGDSQSASITYNPETDQLVFSAFETTGLTQTWYTNRVVGDIIIASGTSYVDVDFQGEQMPTSTYTCVFQLFSNDWYPAVISRKDTTGFSIQLYGTAQEDIEVNFMAHAQQIDNGFGKSSIDTPGSISSLNILSGSIS